MNSNPYLPPTAPVADVGAEPDGVVYAGFWIRVAASLIDVVLLMLITQPLLYAVYGSAYYEADKTGVVAGPADVLIAWVFPAVASILFWMRKRGTPGKLLFGMRVVDARTGRALTLGQSVVRYLGYIVSMVPFLLGYFWVGFDSRKQGWHDKFARSVVVREDARTRRPVRFE